MENIYCYKTTSFTANFKDADSKKGIVTGYGASFGNLDSDGDIIQKGAFSRTIDERGPASSQPRIKHLLNHKPDHPIGKLLMLEEDNKGLYYESQVGPHILGKDFIAMVEGGLITEHSIGFRTLKKEDTREGAILKEIQLWELSSLTGWGANSLTPITSMKSADKKEELEELIKKHRAIEKFCHYSEMSDETIESLLIYNKQLFQFIIDLTNVTTKPGDEPILPENKGWENNWSESDFKPIYHLFNFPRDGTEQYQRGATAYT